MTALIITVVLVTGISFLCSTAEAMLYSIPWTHIEKLRSEGSRAGELLYEMRNNIERPISAILTLNTVANTAGAAFAGALASQVLGTEYMLSFSAFFTALILAFGEIIPKTIGVVYSKPISRIFAYPLHFTVIMLRPITLITGFLTNLVTPKESAPTATEEDIRIMASLSRKSGVIEAYEEKVISNILSLDKKRVHDVMTPRTVVFSLSMHLSLEEAIKNDSVWNFSRIPLYDKDNEDIVGIVQRREVSMRNREGNMGVLLADIMKPINYVLESQTLDVVLQEFLDSRQHLFAVLDEYGGLAGVISLEDVLEEMLGQEIVDESDVATDLRALALQRKASALESAKS